MAWYADDQIAPAGGDFTTFAGFASLVLSADTFACQASARRQVKYVEPPATFPTEVPTL